MIVLLGLELEGAGTSLLALTTWAELNFEAPPAWLGEAVDAVLRDFQQPGPIAIEWRYEPGDGTGTVWLREPADVHGTALWIPDDPRGGVGFLVLLADRLQDQFFPETRSAWGEARPACSGHPHPARAVKVADAAWWTCPLDGRRIARIGHFGKDSSPDPARP
jgi:hypothetical protein